MKNQILFNYHCYYQNSNIINEMKAFKVKSKYIIICCVKSPLFILNLI